MSDMVGLVARIVHTLTVNVSFGAYLYINAVETPAKLSLSSSDAVLQHFQSTFPRARDKMKPAWALATLSGLIGEDSSTLGKIFNFNHIFLRLVLR